MTLQFKPAVYEYKNVQADPEYGKVTGAVSNVNTKPGDFDKFRVSAQNLLPRLRRLGGSIIGIAAFTPRSTFSGPIVRNRVAFKQSLSGTALSIRLFFGLGFAQGRSSARGSIRGDVFTKGASGEPAALPRARIVLHEPVTGDTESDAQGAFAIDCRPPGTHQIDVNAPSLYAGLTAEVSAVTSSTVPVEMNVAAVTSTTSLQLARLKAMDCAFSRKVHHA
jgi:hypothetical protein